MYCTNCGRKLPEDGSPCICGAQNGNFNTQPPQNFQAPPQYYAQLPVRPVTPVHGMLKRFANSMVSPALEFKSEGFVTGLGAKLFTVAGPVLVFGISASVLYGIVLYIIGLF